jgi:hypothetical protein
MVANIENGNARKLDFQPDFRTNCLEVHLEHDPEKWNPVFGKDHAQTKS